MRPRFPTLPVAARLLGGLVVVLPLTASRVQAQQAYGDVSAPAILQLFESSWANMEHRAADAFFAGYGSVWVPPPGRADTGNHSVGYDQYDRFDLGGPGSPTLYGTETGLKTSIRIWQRFGASVYADLVWNHNGFVDNSTPGFIQAGGYPGFVLTAPGAPYGDFNHPGATGDWDGRLAGLIDINHATNFRYIRSPVEAGDPRNIPAGTVPLWGRLANVPDGGNRRLYPSHSTPGRTLWDPATGETVTIHDFRGDGSELLDGTPVEENATGYLMRNAQWYVQDVGFDGFRLDAVKHMPPWVLNYLDRAVYGANPRTHLDGSPRHVFSFGEAYDGDMGLLQAYTRKDINPATPNVVGGNRDMLDFPLHFALRDNLTRNGLANDWRNIVNASFDRNDDGLANNGSQGVAFDASHDDFGAELGNVSNAYLSMRPGNWVVYFNAKEFGNRDFPKDGRGDALGGLYGETITTLAGIRNTHGRGNYQERWLDKETLVYERQNSAVVALNNRMDGGYDQRMIQTSFAPGTHLLELTGNAADTAVDPFNDIPEVVTVDSQGRIAVRIPRNLAANGQEHGLGYVMYGLATPQGELTLSNVSQVLAGGTPTPGTNGTTRLADIEVITADTFSVQLQTEPVNLPGGLRDQNADGDNAVLRFNGGIDANRNGAVDHVNPDAVVYGFEQFLDKHTPLVGGGDGQFLQTIHADDLGEGLNFLEVRAFRHRPDGGPPVYTSFKKAVYIDRFAPVSEVEGIYALAGTGEHARQFRVRSTDQTANSVHVFLNLPASVTDQQVLSMVGPDNHAGQIDRDLFAYGYDNLASGNHVLTVVSYEMTGNVNVQRFVGLGIADGLGRGLGDLNFDGAFDPSDVYGAGGFEEVLWSQNTLFNPAADLNGDARVDSHDLFALRPLYLSHNASAAAAEARRAELRRGNLNLDGTTDAADIDFLHANLGSTGWIFDLDSSGGPADRADVDTLVRLVFLTQYGDVNLDGRVDLLDLVVFRGNFGGLGGWAMGDFNGDGRINLQDLSIMRQHFGFGTGRGYGPMPDLMNIPEPAGVAWLLLPLMGLRRRRCIFRDRGA